MASIDTIASLLAKAENTEFAEEAEAFTAGAQRLASQAGITLEIARRHQKDKGQRSVPVQKIVKIGEKGKQGLGRYLELFDAIARNNDVKWETNGSSMASLRVFGFQSDIEVSELLFNFLVVQMVELGMKHVDKEEWVDEQYWDGEEYKPMTKQLARNSFYQRFSDRIGERLKQARLEAENQRYDTTDDNGNQTSTTGALVLVDKRKSVASYYQENNTVTGHLNTRSPVLSRSSGRAGRAAGSQAKLKADPQIGGQRTAVN